MKKEAQKPIVLLFFLFTIIHVFSQDWTKKSPIPSLNTPTDVHCFNDTTIILALEEGILKTTNSGISWVISSVENDNDINDLFFINNTVGWAVGTDQLIMKSINGGESWSTQNTPVLNSVDLNSVCFIDQDYGWTAGEDGTILYTDNGGVSWTSQNSTTTIDLKTVHFADHLNGSCIGEDLALKTNDGGLSWESITNLSGLEKAEDVFSINEDTCFIIAGTNLGNQIHLTTDGGASWTTKDMGACWLKEISFRDDSHGWIVGRSAASITVDVWGGVSWVDPQITVWKTENCGLSWAKSSYANTDWLFDVSIDGDGVVCASGSYGLVIQTYNDGLDWYQISKGTSKSIYTCQFLNSSTGFAAGDQGAIIFTPDGGDNWTTQDSKNGLDFNSVYFINEDTGFAVGYLGRIRKTSNGGDLWSWKDSKTTNELQSVCFINADTGYIAGENGSIIKSINEGEDWSTQSSGVTNDLFSVYFYNASTGWVVGEDGIVLKTLNGGISWDQKTSNVSSDLLAVYFKNQLEGWTTGSSGLILITKDGGETWYQQSSGTNLELHTIFFLNNDIGWIVGRRNYKDEGIILKTIDGGNSWALSESLDSYPINSVYFTDTDTGWVFGDDGLIMKTTNGGGVFYPIPQLLLPVNNGTEVSLNPTLYWASIDEANSYKIQVSTSVYFSSTIVDESGVNDTSYYVSELDDTRNYYWRVAAEYDGGKNIWSSPYVFRTKDLPPDTPELYSPENGSEGVARIETLDWFNVSGAITYHIQVSGNIGFTDIIFEDSTLTTSSYTPDTLDASTTYYWRVRAKNNGGNSSFSDAFSFTTGLYLINPPPSPVLFSPNNGASGINTSVLLNWFNVSEADFYQLQVSISSDFSSLFFNDSTLSQSEQFIELLDTLTTYYWRVRAKNSVGYSSFSETYSFFTGSEPLTAPGLISPADGNIIVPYDIQFEWSDDINADSYLIQISSDINFESILYSDSSIWWNSFTVEALDPNTTYYWRVRAINSESISEFSTVYSFSTKDVNWILQYTYCISSIHFINEKMGWAVSLNTIVKTTNGGNHWNIMKDNTDEWLRDIFFIDSLHGWVCGDNGYILRSADGGTTWDKSDSQTSLDLSSIHFTDEMHGWATGNNEGNSVILNTTDGGSNWNIVYTDEDYNDLFDIFFIDENTGWAVGFIILKTENAGVDWTVCETDDWISGNSLHFVNENTGWIVGWDGLILKTSNGGDTWINQTSGTTASLEDVFFIDQSNGWAVGGFDPSVILKTSDGGNNWKSISCDLEEFSNANLESVCFVSNDIGWIAGGCLLIKTTNGGGDIVTSIEEFGHKAVISDWLKYQISPNPTTGTFKLFIENIATDISIKIYSINGKLIYHTELKPGNSIIEKNINISGYRRGIYFIQFYNEEKVHTDKVILH